MEKKTGKLQVAILCGGHSVEHEVSLLSAKNVLMALNRDNYEPVVIFIDKAGSWWLVNEEELQHGTLGITHHSPRIPVSFRPNCQGILTHYTDPIHSQKIDVVFPVLHGLHGEDGSVQGNLQLAKIPFVGSDVLGSAIVMDKEVTKQLLQNAAIPIGAFRAFHRQDAIDYSQIFAELGCPVFVKPASLGSSIGIAKASDVATLQAAIANAFSFNKKIMVESFIKGRELECAVLGNTVPKASIVGEIIPSHVFYTYEAKYIDSEGARLIIPASLTASMSDQVRALSVAAFQILNCAGMARVDFFLREDNTLLINEG